MSKQQLVARDVYVGQKIYYIISDNEIKTGFIDSIHRAYGETVNILCSGISLHISVIYLTKAEAILKVIECYKNRVFEIESIILALQEELIKEV